MHNRAAFYHQPKTVAPETIDAPVIAPLLLGKAGDFLPFFLSSSSQGRGKNAKALLRP